MMFEFTILLKRNFRKNTKKGRYCQRVEISEFSLTNNVEISEISWKQLLLKGVETQRDLVQKFLVKSAQNSKNVDLTEKMQMLPH